MAVLKKLASVIAGFLLHAALFFGALAVVFSLLFATPQPIKEALEEAEVYQAFVTTITNSFVEQTGQDTSFAMPENDLRETVAQAIQAEDAQEQFEQAIDAIYDWLRGDANEPEFVIDFNASRERFAEAVSVYAIERLDKLPRCTSVTQLSQDIDPLTADCAPPGFSPEDEAEAYTQELLASDEFIPDTRITSEELFATAEAQQMLDSLKQNFQWLQRGIILASIVTLLLVGLIIGLAPTKRLGVRQTGLQISVAGIWIGFSALVLWVLSDTVISFGESSSSVLQTAITQAGNSLIEQAVYILAICAVSLVVFGLVTRLVVRKPKEN